MKTLTKDTFNEALIGNSLVFIHRLTGCPNCDKVKPLMESFTKDGVSIYDVDVDTERNITEQYAPKGQWNLPLIVYLENGKATNVKTGLVSSDDILNLTKTIQNISDEELISIILNSDIELAQRRKEIFEAERYSNALKKEVEDRKNKVSEQVISNPEPEIECSEECNEILKSRGLGDTISKITHAMGIPECEGCTYRKEKLNKIFPYKG
jgi:hypothetical protein